MQLTKLKELRKANKLTQKEIAAQLGVTQAAYSGWEIGRAGIDKEYLIKLADLFHVSVDFILGRTNDPIDYDNYDGYVPSAFAGKTKELLQMKAATDKEVLETPPPRTEAKTLFSTLPFTRGVPIPIIGTIRAGFNGIAFQDLSGSGYADVDSPDNYFFLRVKGDSMAPHIGDGDLALIRKQPDVESSEIAAVILNGEEGTLKRVVKQGDSIILQPLNALYAPQIVAGDALGDLYIAGKLIETRKTW